MIRIVFRIIILFTFLRYVVIGNAQNSNVEVEIEGIESVDGQILLAVYNSPSSYLKHTTRSITAKVKRKDMTIRVDSLPVGNYVICLFHDKNGNGEFDTNFLGIPKEKYGFSKNPHILFSPPSFDDCKFYHCKEDTIHIKLK